VESSGGLGKVEKIKAMENGRRVPFLHHAATRAERVSPSGFAGGFHKDRASACGIRAVPALTALHHHGSVTSLFRGGGAFAKIWLSAEVRYVEGIEE